MCATQVGGSLGHGGKVQRLIHRPGAFPQQGSSLGSVHDMVLIQLSCGRVPRVKIIWNLIDRQRADVGREMGVQGTKPLPLGESAIGSEAGDLPEGVNAGIGSAGSDNREPRLCDRRKGVFQRLPGWSAHSIGVASRRSASRRTQGRA